MKSILRCGAALLMTIGLSIMAAGSAQAATPKWLSVDADESHTCAVATDHSLWCWGNNDFGQLGSGFEPDRRDSPTRVGTSTKWKSVTVGRLHTCALHSSGSIYCWGQAGSGRLGLPGFPDNQPAPRKVGSSTSWTSVEAGGDATCATHASGSLYCWGYNSRGQLGVGDNDNRYTPTKVGSSTSWRSVSLGRNNFTCARHSTGALYCWGANEDGQLGLGNTSDRNTPKKVGTSTSWTGVDLGDDHTCATHATGALYCWGRNVDGQLGLGDNAPRTTPKKVGTSTSWTTVSAGGKHTCARHKSGSMYCWGYNFYGQLGLGDNAPRTTPRKVGTSTSWTTVSAGGIHTCARHSSGPLYCSGDNEYGQLGLGDTNPRNTLKKIP